MGFRKVVFRESYIETVEGGKFLWLQFVYELHIHQ